MSNNKRKNKLLDKTLSQAQSPVLNSPSKKRNGKRKKSMVDLV
jgi:hypothetical protein